MLQTSRGRGLHPAARGALVRPAALLALPFLLAALPSPAGRSARTVAQTPNPRQRQAIVSVVAPDGKPVTGLTAADFTVREDGVAREVLRVAPAADPVDVALLVDNTQAVTDVEHDIRDGVKAFVQDLSARDPIAVITFADRPTVLSNYSLDRAAALKAVERIFPQEGSGSDLLDAIVEASRGLARRSGQGIIVVVTGEGREFSNLNDTSVLDAVKASGATLHAEILLNTGDQTTDDPGRNRGLVLDEGPRASGGRSRTLLSSLGLRAELTSLAAEINNRYLVTYGRPEMLIPPEKIDVAVKRPDCTVRATPVKTRPDL
jgi:Ca-activated chloride channel family protein